VAGDAPSLTTSIALLAFTADGHTQVVIGTRGNEREEIMMTRPHKIIAPAPIVRGMLEEPTSPEPSRLRRWLARAPRLPAALRRERADRDGTVTPAVTPATLAGRARWLCTGASLALSTRARARKFVTLEIDDSLV
jgi:hypothetical protein